MEIQGSFSHFLEMTPIDLPNPGRVQPIVLQRLDFQVLCKRQCLEVALRPAQSNGLLGEPLRHPFLGLGIAHRSPGSDIHLPKRNSLKNL